LTTYLVARRKRATAITITAALLAVVAAAVPAAAQSPSRPAHLTLREGAGMAGAPSASVRNVQRALLLRGYDLGPRGGDGRFGPLTAGAVRRFQSRAGLVADGIVGARTRLALRGVASRADLAEGAGMGRRPSERVRLLQRQLVRAGFSVGRAGADGRFGPLTAVAVRRLGRTHGLTADAVVDRTTRHALRMVADSPRNPQPAAPAQPSTAPTVTNVDRQRRAAASSARPPANIATPPSDDSLTLVATLAALIAALPACAALLLALRAREAKTGRRLRPTSAMPFAATRRPRDEIGGSDDPAAAPDAARPGQLTLQAQEVKSPRRLGPSRPKPSAAAGRARDGIGGSDARPAAPPRPSAGAPRQTDVPSAPPVRTTSRRRKLAAHRQRGPAPLAPGDAVIGYITLGKSTVPTKAALNRINSVCDENSWQIIDLVHDEYVRDAFARPGLARALDRIAAGEARALVVGDMHRLAPSLPELSALLEWFRDADAVLVAPTLQLDTSTADGDWLARTLGTVQSWDGRRPATPRPRRSPAARTNTEPGRSA
jgi:peptidoglycan hydrolase-like protein with peptidoglycan-binding domain